jgi:alpha-N-acetylglucosamine transferase
MEFHIVKLNSKYNILFDSTSIQQLCVEVSTIRSYVQFLTMSGMDTVKIDYLGEDAELTTIVENMMIKEIE